MKIDVASADPPDPVLSYHDHGVKVVHQVSTRFEYFVQGLCSTAACRVVAARPDMPREASKL
ncbi:MAG: hypothetical protein F4X40_07175 [Chloroflexi bacterium]|nr:hypothetical protein [Chloroflexota bacterium]